MIFNSRNHEMNQSKLLYNKLAWAERSSGKRCLVFDWSAVPVSESVAHKKSDAPSCTGLLVSRVFADKTQWRLGTRKNACDRVAIGFCFTSVLNANEQLLQFGKSQSGAFNRNGLLVSRPTMDIKTHSFQLVQTLLVIRASQKKWEKIQRLIVRSLCR